MLEDDHVDLDRVAHRVKVAARVVVDVDGLNRHLKHADVHIAQLEQDIHLVLVALAVNARHRRERADRQAAKARLRIAHADAADQGVHRAGDLVAPEALLGDIARKRAGPEDQRIRVLVHRLDQAQDVLRGVLPVRVGGDDAAHVRPLEHAGVDARLERTALAHVHRMHGDLRAQRAAAFKDMCKSLLTAVIHQHHAKALLNQFAGQVDEALVRLVRRNQYDSLVVFHMISSENPCCFILLMISGNMNPICG